MNCLKSSEKTCSKFQQNVNSKFRKIIVICFSNICCVPWRQQKKKVANVTKKKTSLNKFQTLLALLNFVSAKFAEFPEDAAKLVEFKQATLFSINFSENNCHNLASFAFKSTHFVAELIFKFSFAQIYRWTLSRESCGMGKTNAAGRGAPRFTPQLAFSPRNGR